MAQAADPLLDLDAQIKAAKAAVNATGSAVNAQVSSAWTPGQLLFAGGCVLVFGIVVLVLVTYLMKKGRHGDYLLRTYGTLLIIIAAVYLVVAGYTEKQMGPAMGLLGTLAGYLLGRATATEPRIADNRTFEGTTGGGTPSSAQ